MRKTQNVSNMPIDELTAYVEAVEKRIELEV